MEHEVTIPQSMAQISYEVFNILNAQNPENCTTQRVHFTVCKF